MKLRHHLEFVFLAIVAVAGLVANTDPSRQGAPDPAPWVTLFVAVGLAAMAGDLIVAVWRKCGGRNRR